MKHRRVSVGAVLAGVTTVVLGGALGCNAKPGGPRVPALPDELVVWGDPDPDNPETYASIRDVHDQDDVFVVIGTNGQVQLANEKVCNICEVQGSTILIDGTPRINIRFSSGPDGFGPRRPFLVSTDAFYIELVGDETSITFQEENVRFEEDDNLTDDLAVRVGTIPNPALEN